MKSIKYLNMILTVIAFCLCAITASLFGFIPTANGNSRDSHFTTIPVNPDGSISVRWVNNETLDVNIDEINGHSLNYATIPVNIKETYQAGNWQSHTFDRETGNTSFPDANIHRCIVHIVLYSFSIQRLSAESDFLT